MNVQKMYFLKPKNCNLSPARSGQSLIEVLIAMVIGTIMVVAAVSIITPVLQTSTAVNKAEVAIALGKELAENVRIVAGADWHAIDSLATTTQYSYHVTTATSPFAVVAGDENIVLATSTYTRYFFVDDVKRDVSGVITAIGGTYDPSTKKATVVYGPTARGGTSTIVSYLTRARTKVFVQTDWSGGAGVEGPATSTSNRFATSTQVDAMRTVGSLLISKLNGPEGAPPPLIPGDGTINGTYRYAWSENIGWIDFYDTQTVRVNSSQMKGYATSTVGYVWLDCATSPMGNICGTSNFKVTNNGAGVLAGWAWNDTTGWISFNCANTGSCGVSNYGVVIDPLGDFSGWAWSDTIGWISFNCMNTGACGTSDYRVKTTWTP